MAERIFKRGEIYWVNLPDSDGREIKETHPAIVISNNKQNIASPLIIVLPITSFKEGDKIYSFQVPIKLKKDSVILVDQIRTIDRDKFGDFIKAVEENVLEKIEKCIHSVLALKKS